MAVRGHFASPLHGEPDEVTRVRRSGFLGELAYLADCAGPEGVSVHSERVRAMAVAQKECSSASGACEGDGS